MRSYDSSFPMRSEHGASNFLLYSCFSFLRSKDHRIVERQMPYILESSYVPDDIPTRCCYFPPFALANFRFSLERSTVDERNVCLAGKLIALFHLPSRRFPNKYLRRAFARVARPITLHFQNWSKIFRSDVRQKIILFAR